MTANSMESDRATVNPVSSPVQNQNPESVAAESSPQAEPTDSASDPAQSRPGCESLEEIAALPRDVGWFLLIGGLLSELGAPGVPPFWILGIMILWPRIGIQVGTKLQRRAPKLFKGCLTMVGRYADDLERRYPRRR